MKIFNKFYFIITLLFAFYTIFIGISSTLEIQNDLKKQKIEFKKDIRQTKENILLNHNFNKYEIELLLDY